MENGVWSSKILTQIASVYALIFREMDENLWAIIITSFVLKSVLLWGMEAYKFPQRHSHGIGLRYTYMERGFKVSSF